MSVSRTLDLLAFPPHPPRFRKPCSAIFRAGFTETWRALGYPGGHFQRAAIVSSFYAPQDPAPVGLGQAAPALAARLAEARGVIEDKFLDLGQILETSVEVVSGLIGSLDQLTVLFNAEAVDETTAKLSSAAEKLHDLAASRQGPRARFEDLAAATRRLAAEIADMQRALRYLRVIAVNIKVTAGGVPGAYAEFEEFAEEIRRTVAGGREQLDELAREVEKLQQRVGAALSHEAELERRCGAVLPDVPNQLAADAKTMAAHHKQVATVAADVGGLARSLQRKVGGALGGLQIGDNTRQRVEHVETALEILARRGADETVAPFVRAMLAAQLNDTADIFASEVDKVAESLAGLANDASEVLRLKDIAHGGRSSAGDKGGVLARLEVSLGRAMSLVREVEAAEAAAEAIGRSAEATAADLVRRIGSIRAIKTTIHQMALNAHLKCCRLGEAAKPLSVIAVELRQHADTLGDTASKAEAILDGLAGAPTGSADGAATRSASQVIGTLLEEAAAPIRAAEGKVGGDLAALASQGDAVVEALERAPYRLNFRGDVGEVLYAAAAALSPAEVGAPDTLPAEAGTALAETLAEIGKHYTMARERQVHAPFTPPMVEAEEPEAPAPAPAADDDFEMFDDAPATVDPFDLDAEMAVA